MKEQAGDLINFSNFNHVLLFIYFFNYLTKRVLLQQCLRLDALKYFDSLI